jgi:hypothetical protein
MPPPVKKNGWSEWSIYVLKSIERNEAQCKEILHIAQSLDKRITILEVRAGFFGLLGGSIPGIVYLLIKVFNGGSK